MKYEASFNATGFLACDSAEAIKRILSAALESANPSDAILRRFTRDGDLLRVNGREYALKNFSSVYIISVGKAAISMAEAASKVLDEHLTAGIVVSKQLSSPSLSAKNGQGGKNDLSVPYFPKFTFIESSHPLPDARSLAAGEKTLEFLAKTSSDDLVIFLISGGGSALMTAPVDGVSLTDMEKLTSLLLRCGARIDEVNTLRRALDRVKGGGLARAAFPATIISLLLSDVVDSPLEAIASGPTAPNPTSHADALTVLEKYNLFYQIPAAVLAFLKKDIQFEDRDLFSKGNTLIVGSNIISARAAKAQAMLEGFDAQVLTTSLQGEAAQVGRELAMILRGVSSNEVVSFFEKSLQHLFVKRPFCLIAGGETTVTLRDTVGLGGRNQEVALAAVSKLAGVESVMFITLATDGEDGPTDAAGAVVTGETFVRAQILGLDVEAHLQNHDAYPFFDKLGDLLKIGSTGTNVNDLTFLFGF